MKKLHLLFFVLSFYTTVNAQIGLPDPSFGNNGYIATPAPSTGNASNSTSIACFLDPTGGISLVLQSSSKTMISKRLQSGLPDLTYGRNGYSAAISMIVTAAAMQADGKIVAGGTPNGSDNFMLARYHTNGDLDSTFGNSGIIIWDGGLEVKFLNSVAIATDGKILAGGMTLINTTQQFILFRFSANGNPDQSFGNNGAVTTNFGQYSALNKILVQPDNKIMAVGVVGAGTGGDFALARYNVNGTPDSSFNGNGRLTRDFGFNDAANSIVQDATGKMYVGGNSNDSSGKRHFRIARFNTNGSPDYSYNAGLGSIMAVFDRTNDFLSSICLQTDGSIIASGNSNLVSGDIAVQMTRIKVDGSIDLAFGRNGLLIAGSNNTHDDSRFVVVAPDGNILTGGTSRQIEPPYLQNFSCFRFLADGSPDLGFGNLGLMLEFTASVSYSYNAVFLQGDGRLLAASQLRDGNSFALNLSRFNRDGSPDNTFGEQGVKKLSDDPGGFLNFQPDGKLVWLGYSPTNNGDIQLLRYNTDGSPDGGFGVAGKVVTDLGGNEAWGSTAFQADGKIIVGGSSSDTSGSDWLIIRYNPDGSIDNSFGTNGVVRKNILKEDNIESIVLAPDGQIIVGGRGYNLPVQGNFTGFFMLLAKLNSNGTFDQGFGDNGVRIISRSTFNYLGSFKAQNDGKLVFAYGSSQGATTEDFLERLNADGTGDVNFGLNGRVAIDGLKITLHSDQKILVPGTYRNNRNNTEFSLSRYSRDGKIDYSFGDNGRTLSSFAPVDNALYIHLLSGGFFFAAGSGVDKWGQNIGVISKFIVSPIQLCPPTASTSIVSDKTGTNYQWQVNTDSSFVNLSNSVNYSGVNTRTLQITNAPSSWNGHVYRCVVDGNNSSSSEITFADTWTGSASNAWENAGNWSCGAIPDANTDVIIENGNVEVNANTTIRSLQVNSGAKVTVKTGVIFTILHK